MRGRTGGDQPEEYQYADGGNDRFLGVRLSMRKTTGMTMIIVFGADCAQAPGLVRLAALKGAAAALSRAHRGIGGHDRPTSPQLQAAARLAKAETAQVVAASARKIITPT
jgi:hypothetical protein